MYEPLKFYIMSNFRVGMPRSSSVRICPIDMVMGLDKQTF